MSLDGYKIELRTVGPVAAARAKWDAPAAKWDAPGAKWDRVVPASEGLWVDVTEDVRRQAPVAYQYGLPGSDPGDRVARPGTFSFALDNSENNSLSLLGLYSPDHMNCRAGFALGSAVRIRYFDQVLFVGKIDSIAPEVGLYGNRITQCTAIDFIEELSRFFINTIPIQTNKYSHQLLSTIIAAMPNPPAAQDFDTGVDLFAVALDNTQGTTALTEGSRIANSEHALLYFLPRDGGTLRLEGRARRLFGSGAPVADLTVTAPHGLDVKHDASRVINRVQVSVNIRNVQQHYSVLYALDEPIFVPQNSVRVIEGKYRNPDNLNEQVSGANVVTPLEPGLDYKARIVPDSEVPVGTPDTAGIMRPSAAGFYTAGATGTPASLADGNDNTGMSPTSGLVKHSVKLSGIPEDVAANAAVEGVRVTLRLKHSPESGNIDGSGFGGFFVLYPSTRTKGIDIDLYQTGTTINHMSGYSSGMHVATFEMPGPASGGNWTVGLLRETELVWMTNWGGGHTALPLLAEAEVRLTYAGQDDENDRTDDVTVTAAPGAMSATFTITNPLSEGVFVRVQIRGQIVFKGTPTAVEVSDPASVASFGRKDLSLDMPYQPSTEMARAIASYVLFRRKGAETHADSLTVFATDQAMLDACLAVDISSVVRIQDELTGIDKLFWVNSVRGEIDSEGYWTFTWGLAPADEQTYFTIGVSKIGGPDAIAPF